MIIQFFVRDASTNALVRDGEPITLSQGQTGYIAAGRIHDAKVSDTSIFFVCFFSWPKFPYLHS